MQGVVAPSRGICGQANAYLLENLQQRIRRGPAGCSPRRSAGVTCGCSATGLQGRRCDIAVTGTLTRRRALRRRLRRSRRCIIRV